MTWVFFDVGETLMDERPTNAAWASVVADVLSDVTVEQVLRAQRAAAAGGVSDPKRGAVDLLAGDAAEEVWRAVSGRSWPLLDEPFPDAAPCLEALVAAGYRLGVIANQRKAESQARLEWSGLLEHIEVTVLSGDVGIAKPNPAIFQLALQMAGCTASDAVMVGDRLDNDIAPAKAIGMCTVWLRRGLHEDYTPRTQSEEPRATIGGLGELPRLLGEWA